MVVLSKKWHRQKTKIENKQWQKEPCDGSSFKRIETKSYPGTSIRE